MTDARWIEVEDDFAKAAFHFRNAAALHAEGGYEDEGLAGYRTVMAMMHAMQSGYTSLESGLIRVLDLLGEERPTGEAWHSDLLRRAARRTPTRPPILSPEIFRVADKTRRFRHVAMKSYDLFDPREAGDAVAAAAALAERLLQDLAAFRAAIDPPDEPNPAGASAGDR